MDQAVDQAAPFSPRTIEPNPAASSGSFVSGREFWTLSAPWLGYGLLAAAALFGLAVASGGSTAASDSGGAYAAGMITFGLAVVIIALRLKQQLDGKPLGLLLAVRVTQPDALAVSVAIMGVLGLGGAVVAATLGGVFYGVGLALFIICAAFIFANLKSYFDRRDRLG